MKKTLFILLLGFVLASCNNEKQPITVAGELTGIEDFDNFYKRFHRDTAYQAAHITFPLEGLPPNADSLDLVEGEFRWHRSDWEYHQMFNDQSFERRFKIFGDFMIEENLLHKTGQFGIVRRFSKMNDEWFLIYYIAPNKVKLPDAPEEVE